MADTFCHATQGGLLLAGPFIRTTRKKWVLWTLGFVGAFLGALPDIIGGYGNWVEHDHYRLYVSAHRGAIEQILLYVPMYSLHLFVDTLTHGSGRRWWLWNEGLWLETLLWIINILLFYWLVRIWRRNAERTPRS